MNEYVKFFEINQINQIYWIFEEKNKLIPTADSIANIETSAFVPQFSDGLGGVIRPFVVGPFVVGGPSDPLHTDSSDSSHSPLQQVVLP